MDNDGIMECIDLMCDTLPQLRNALNLTQEDFSKIIGVSRQSVINMEHKEKKLTRSTISRGSSSDTSTVRFSHRSITDCVNTTP